MKKLIFSLILLMSGVFAFGQYTQVTHLAGSAVYAGVTVSLTTSGSTGTGGGDCLTVPVPYRTGGAPGAAPGMRTFVCSQPVYSIRLLCERIHEDEYVSIFINGVAYPLTAANMLSLTDCYGLYFCSLVGGDIYGPPGGEHSAGDLIINSCTGIDSFSVWCFGNYGGSTFYAWIDPTRCVSATSNSAICVGDTLKLFANGGDTLATYTWYGPGGYTAIGRNQVRLSATAAMAGTYTVVQAGGRSKDTATVNVVVESMPIVPAILPHVRVCSGVTLTLQLDPTTVQPGVTYIWSGPNSYSYTGTTPTLTNIITAASGLYSVYAVSASGGCRTTQQHNNFVVDSTPALPTASNNGAICSDSLLRLFADCATAGVTYGWAGPALYTSTYKDPYIYNATTSMSGNYTVTVTLGLCTNQAVTTVLVNATPINPVVGSNSPVCSGGVLNLNASFTPYTGIFHWSGPASFTSLLQNPSIINVTAAAAGTYSVYEISNGCTSDTVEVNVVIDPTPAVPVGSSNAPVCEGGDLFLHATDATAGVTYSWTGPNSFSSTLQDPVISPVTPAADGIYTIVATLGACSATGIANVDITNAPTVTATSNSPVCSGDTLKLIANTALGNTVAWIGPYTFSAAGPTPTRYPAIMEYAGVYQAVATEPGGCSSIAYDTVVIKQTPDAPWLEWLTYCQFDYAPQLHPIDATNVLWFPSSSGGTGTATAPTPNTDVPGVYFFFLNQTVNGCPSMIDSIQVLVNPKPSVTLTPADTAICPRDSIVYRTTSTDPLATYSWYPSTYLTRSVGASTVAYPVADISYYIIATNTSGCTDTAQADVRVHPAALITLTSGDSVYLAPGESYHIQPVTNCVSFNWFPPEGLSNPFIADPTVTPEFNTRFIVTGYTEKGCSATDSIAFHVNDQVLYGVPNAFTPGTGANSILKLYSKGTAKLNYFRIFNRWGNMVFETTDINQGWDGTYKGEPQPFGVYVYEIVAVSLYNNKATKLSGNITLLR